MRATVTMRGRRGRREYSAERGLLGGTGYGSGSVGFAGADGNSDGTDGGGEYEYDAGGDNGICDGRVARGGDRDAVGDGDARGSVGIVDTVFHDGEQGEFLWSGAGVSEDDFAVLLLRECGGYGREFV